MSEYKYKCKAYIKKTHEIVDVLYINLKDGTITYPKSPYIIYTQPLDDIVLMPFIGLQDRNGNDIYCHFKVKIKNSLGDYLDVIPDGAVYNKETKEYVYYVDGLVEWDSAEARFAVFSPSTDPNDPSNDDQYDFDCYLMDDFEIIGTEFDEEIENAKTKKST